ncbi:hypothetical protein, partial [Neisseria sp. P0001.S002]|uniref:hypothetical protein n=1 Tax=Neisseria sp. P0001.S002 TaxID=3436646 RepID=UPI003F81FAC3
YPATGIVLFQHTAARRRLVFSGYQVDFAVLVSTHSRPKAAGHVIAELLIPEEGSTHSRPKAAGQMNGGAGKLDKVATHSRPKAAG